MNIEYPDLGSTFQKILKERIVKWVVWSIMVGLWVWGWGVPPVRSIVLLSVRERQAPLVLREGATVRQLIIGLEPGTCSTLTVHNTRALSARRDNSNVLIYVNHKVVINEIEMVFN